MTDDRAEPGGGITELATRPPEEWELFRPVQIPFGLFGVDRMMADWKAGKLPFGPPKPISNADLVESLMRAINAPPVIRSR